MGFLSGILDRLVLVGSVLAGGAIPSFIAQFRQRLGGHLDQVLKDLKPFQEIANQFHGGSLDALIKHHLGSTDPSFRGEGNAIAAMQHSARMLGEALQALQGSIPQQINYLFTQSDRKILKAAWGAFEPAFSFTPEGFLFAGAFGVSVWLIFLVLLAILGRIFGRSSRNNKVQRALRR